MKVAIALICATVFSSAASATSECAWVGNEMESTPCGDGVTAWACVKRTPEAVKAHQDCEDGIAARDAALISLASRVGAEDLAGKTVYGWHYVLSTDEGKHQYDMVDLLIKTLDKAKASEGAAK